MEVTKDSSNRLVIKKMKETDKVIALAGNPNVGKSTVFNSLTGLRQHTGNWPGKTVANAQGYCTYKNKGYVLVDIPGCYSLSSHSAEEEIARDFICFGESDAIVVVCDATCLEKNLNLVLQVLEITNKVVVCVNLMDEAKKKNICVNLKALSDSLGVKVVGTSARSGKGLNELMDAVGEAISQSNTPLIKYDPYIEEAITELTPYLNKAVSTLNSRWLSLRLLEEDQSFMTSLNLYLGFDILQTDVKEGLEKAKAKINSLKGHLSDKIVSSIIKASEEINRKVIIKCKNCNLSDRRLDRILTGKWTAFPIMFVLLMFIFWLTISGANYPSEILSRFLFGLQDDLISFFKLLGVSKPIYDAIVLGAYRTLAWVASVMLPPMAIFFPLFTMLEDFGYLPRVAFNLDKCFKKCSACGKQALTMCMGFGCNAAGVTGCRIIDSPRERLIATITNCFVPCNGRFPTLIAIITMFFVGTQVGLFQSVMSSVILSGLIVFSILITLFVSKLLSKTLLKGIPSSFTLELPPYRKPQIGKVIIRSIIDRTLFVLGRAAAVAAPAGLIIFLMANIRIDNITLLTHCSGFLDPFARLLGLDGTILFAFILGFPANEIVVPIILMAYMAQCSLPDISNLDAIRQLLIDNGWTWVTAVSTMLFSLMHWPCSTTCLTIRKETQSFKWTAISIVLPTVLGMIICFFFASAARLLG